MIKAKIEFNDGREAQSFPTLHLAKKHVWENKLTGWINISYPQGRDNFMTHESIEVRKGKRRGMKEGTWVPCL